MLMEFIGARRRCCAAVGADPPGVATCCLACSSSSRGDAAAGGAGLGARGPVALQRAPRGPGCAARLVIIDWPQVVDVIGNPHGLEFLERDARNMCDWFTRRGFEVDEGLLFGDLVAAATMRW